MHKLETKGISKSFGDNTILKDISIWADQGELISLLGVSGSGKTTLFNCISESESDLMVDPDLNAMGAPGAEWARR